jgi:uncharacterized membrane protein YgaE (UPF0421/DUF939 family)
MIPYRLRGRATILRLVQLPLRAGLAAALSQAIAVFLGLPYPAFAMVAAILVTDLAPEQSRQLGLRRIGGTLIGAALGAMLGAILEPHPWSIALSIVAAMSMSNLLRADEGARLAGFTSAVVLLSPGGGNPWNFALHRFLETVLGILVAWGVSHIPRLFVPGRRG